MDTSLTPACFRNDGGAVSLLSVPDLESLEEITDGDVQELLHLMLSTARMGEVSPSVVAASEETEESRMSATRSDLGLAEPPPSLPSQLTPSSSNSSDTSGSASHTLSRRNSAHRNSAQSSMTAEFSGLPAPPTAFAVPLRQTRTSAPATAAGANGAESGRTSCRLSSRPHLAHVSDTALLDAEQRRWGCQLVQECWMHQELHNVRWNEQRLLKHGAAYRPRAIASRTAVKMTHTKSLCIALNVDVSIIENAGDSQVEEDGEEGSSENARMPSLSSPEAEAWSPLLMWRSPALTPGDAPTVLSQLSECLSEQYEGLAPRPLPTSCCANARPSDLVQTLSDARKDAGDAKVIFHYLARGVPPPRGGNLYLMNAASGASGYAGPPYSKLSLDTFRSRVGFPLVFIADCAEAREILNYYIRMCEEQHLQRYFTSSREYQLKSSRQVSAAELDNLAESPADAASGNFNRVGSGADLNVSDNFRRGRGGGGTDGTPPAQSAVLQDFYFIGASGSSFMGSGTGAGVNSLRDKSVGGGGYEDFHMSSNNLPRGGFVGGGGSGGAAAAGSAGGNGNAGTLRHHARLPSDILTSCLTTPLRMAVLWFIAERPELQELHPLLLRLFPGALNDKKTPLGQLHWYLQSIIECIAWSTLSLPEYSRLFREDVYVAPLFRGYILAERIIVGGLDGCLSVYPPLAPTHSHTLWNTWDNLVERACVSVLRAVHPAPPRCASVLEFRGWLDEQVTAWKYTRQDLLAPATNHSVAPSTSIFPDGRHSRLPVTPDEAAVIMPSLLTESLRGMQAQLDGIIQQSFERPRVFFAEIIGLQLPSPPSSTFWDTGRVREGGISDERKSGWRSRRQTPVSGCTTRSAAGAGQQRAGEPLLRDLSERYSNALRSSYSAPQQLGEGVPTSEGARSDASTAASAVSMVDLLKGTGGAGSTRNASSRLLREQPHSAAAGKGKAAETRVMPERADPRAAPPTSRYQRTSQANLSGHTGAVAATGGGGATTTAPPANPAAAVLARSEAHRTSSRLAGRKAEYVTNLFTNNSTSGQASSFHYTAELTAAKESGDVFVGSPVTSSGFSAAVQPPPQHTFPFMDRMPLLLQALLVAAHREKATELICRLVDCGPAAVLQCAEANIYRFVFDRYWSRPDLRFLMPSTLFIYCKSCYADPELIGSAKQRDIAIKACAEILQSPVVVPPLESSAGVTVEEAPGAWQNATLGPYATPYGQRMLAAALLTLIALHTDGGREACHRYGVFQLCCQLLCRTREDAPLLLMNSLELSATGAAAAASPSPGPSMPPLPRAPSSTLGSNQSWSSPLQVHSRAAAAAAAASANGVEESPPPASIATTYHVTLLTLFVSLLCNWKPAAAPESEGDGDDADEDDDAALGAKLIPPLNGTVHELLPTTPQVLAAGLRAASSALLNFTYSDRSILRGAALRCFMMVLISPAPSQVSRNHFVEVELHIIQGETLHRCELNTDLRLEELGMAYTTFRWLLDQLREDLPLEEIGQYVAVWVYKWFKLSAQGKTPISPLDQSGAPTTATLRGASASPQAQRKQQQHQLSSSYEPSARNQWMASTSMSYRAPGVVTPGSVYSHRGSNVLVPAARSVYGATARDAAGGGVEGSLANAMAIDLRQHMTRQDHRRLQSCLPPLSNLVRLFFEHTQDACPYIRTYARKVVTEEFGFLRQSWYDDYAAQDLHPSQREEDYGGHYHHQSHRPNQRHRSYGARQDLVRDTHLSGDAGNGAVGGIGARQSADPLTASSVDGGGDLTTYLPLREMLSAGEVFDDLLGGGAASGAGPRMGSSRPTSSATSAATGAAVTGDVYAAPAFTATEVEDVADPHPAVLRRFIGRLLRIASTNGADGSSSISAFPRNSSRHHMDLGRGGGMQDGDDDVPLGDLDDRAGGYRRGGHNGYTRSGSEREGEVDEGEGQRGGGSRRRRGVSGERGPVGEGEAYYPSTYPLDQATDEDAQGELGGTLLDSETLALHPLWAMDSTSMTNFAYGALSFLERFMLEKMDDSDPRHPMNLEKENALHHYYQRVERNIRAFAQDEMPGGEVAGLGSRRMDIPTLAKCVETGENEATAGSRAFTAASAAPPPFHCLGEGDIGEAGIPGYSQRRGGRARRSGFAHSARRGGRSSDMAENGARVGGSVDVVLFHPSEPLVIASTTGGLLSVWSYDHLGLPTTGEEEDAERVHGRDADDIDESDKEEAAEDAGDGVTDGETAEPPHPCRRVAKTFRNITSTAPRRQLHAKAQFFLRDVVGRSRSDLYNVARPRFMYDRFNPNGEAPTPRGDLASQRRLQRGTVDGWRGVREREAVRNPGNFYRRDEMAAGGGGGAGSRAGAWMDRAEAANAIAALPSSYQHGHPHYYHGVGDLHLVDAAQHPLICAVRRFGAVEVFSHFTDGQRVRRVVTFETARFGHQEGADQCVSSYQSCTGLLYVSDGVGGVSAWDLGNEQRLAAIGTLASADSVSGVGAGTISALQANPYTPYEYLVGSYGKQMCLFDLRDGSGGGAARLGYAHPSSQFFFGSASPMSRHGGGGTSPLSSLCVRVCYSRRYPEAVVAGYACGTVAVWDRRYPKEPSVVFGAAVNGVALQGAGGGEGGGGWPASAGLGVSPMPVEGGASTMIRQLDVHPCSKRFLTLTTTPTTLQLTQPYRLSGGDVGGEVTSSGGRPLSSARRCSTGTSCVVESYDLTTYAAGGVAGESAVERRGSEPGAACFHDFSPVLCVGAGSSVRLYGTSHLSTMATYMDVDFA